MRKRLVKSPHSHRVELAVSAVMISVGMGIHAQHGFITCKAG